MVTAYKRFNLLTLSQGKKKKGDDVAHDEDDDAVRTSVTRPSDSDVLHHTVYIALPTYQKGQL
jgi:hypothetical protein